MSGLERKLEKDRCKMKRIQIIGSILVCLVALIAGAVAYSTGSVSTTDLYIWLAVVVVSRVQIILLQLKRKDKVG